MHYSYLCEAKILNVDFFRMPRRKIICPICQQVTERPPQHFRVKHKIPVEEIPALVAEARQKVQIKTVQMKEVVKQLPNGQPITLKDVVKVIEWLGFQVDGKVCICIEKSYSFFI